MNKTHHIDQCEKWRTMLNELRVKNIRLKDQLSEAIARKVTPAFVEQAEKFQQLFVEKDQIIDLLRQDVSSLLREITSHNMPPAQKQQCITLEKDIAQLVNAFNQMEVSFSEFLKTGKTA